MKACLCTFLEGSGREGGGVGGRFPLPPNLILSWGTALIKQCLTFQQSLLKITQYCVPLLHLYKVPNYLCSAFHSEAPKKGCTSLEWWVVAARWRNPEKVTLPPG